MIAFLVANLALIGIFVPSVASAGGLNEIYGYSCCGGGFDTVNYHPGETLKVDWIRTALRKSVASSTTIDLSVTSSGPFTTIVAAEKAYKGSHPVLGRTKFSATTLQVSDEKIESPVSLLQVPASAGTGFYELTSRKLRGITLLVADWF
jgi:predicted RNA binding protein YcfA (HicA-like mRNA interferase family)